VAVARAKTDLHRYPGGAVRVGREREVRLVLATAHTPPIIMILLLLAAQHVQQVVFTHRLGQRQVSVLAARVVEVRLVKNMLLL
jgi:hypothetical protein